ncbi:MAG: AlpA family transcriptional regulator [Salinisphaeraceae bacterium]|nr:AlpA family transcriptional regulator [Salinisphaeraceae bacterium]
MNSETTQKFLTVRDVAERYSLGVSTVWQKTGSGEIPSPVQLTARTTRWRLSDLVAWESTRPLITENRN